MKGFWRDGLSINETKVSTLMILLSLSVACFWVYAFVFHKFNEQAVWLCTALLGGVTGINIANTFAKKGDNDGL